MNNLFPPYANGGTESAVQKTIDVLQKNNYKVVLITSEPHQSTANPWSVEKKNQLTIYRYRPKNIYYYTEGANKSIGVKMLWHSIDMLSSIDAQTIKSILKMEKPTIVHGHNLKGISYAFPKVCKELSIPYIHSLHNYQLLHPFGTFTDRERPPDFTPRPFARLYRGINRRLFRHTAGVISPTVLPLRIHQNAGFFLNIPTTIIPSPVSAPKMLRSPILDGKLKLVYLGALEEIKGIRALINVILKLSSEPVTLDVFGDGSLLHELQKSAKGASQIRFLDRLEDKDILGKYDALAFPSICYETQGLSMVEALVRGTPVIASNIGSIPESVQDGANGYLFTSGNEQELASLLLRCLREPTLLSNLRPATLQSGKQFSERNYGQKIVSFYELSISR